MPETPSHILDTLTEAIGKREAVNETLVAINGKDALGMTILADNLANHLQPLTDQPVLRVSFNEYLNPHEIRNQPFKDEARGNYDQAFNYIEFAHDMDEFSRMSEGIFIVDGLFLFRSFLWRHWHLRVLLDAPENTVDPRQEIYYREQHPYYKADIIIDTTDPIEPLVTKNRV